MIAVVAQLMKLSARIQQGEVIDALLQRAKERREVSESAIVSVILKIIMVLAKAVVYRRFYTKTR